MPKKTATILNINGLDIRSDHITYADDENIDLYKRFYKEIYEDQGYSKRSFVSKLFSDFNPKTPEEISNMNPEEINSYLRSIDNNSYKASYFYSAIIDSVEKYEPEQSVSNPDYIFSKSNQDYDPFNLSKEGYINDNDL
ncbi:hypothetical protein L3V86_00170 [Thiotrichales bacterium 19S11-10]|nr:hypothetical protein [Thiotrichales bacterium 19S11-10]